MNGSNIEFVVTSMDDVKDVCQIMSSIGSMALYTVPDLIGAVGMAKLMFNGKFKIIVMVDYPNGDRKGTDKFKGMHTNFFLTDGYDIVLTPRLNDIEMENEIKSTYFLVNTMINPTVDIIYTINASMRSENEIKKLAVIFNKKPPTRIKLESLTTIQPTKANFDVHQNTINLINKYCATPITISGNVTYNIYKEFSKSCRVAVSINQYRQIQKHEELSKVKLQKQ